MLGRILRREVERLLVRARRAVQLAAQLERAPEVRPLPARVAALAAALRERVLGVVELGVELERALEQRRRPLDLAGARARACRAPPCIGGIIGVGAELRLEAGAARLRRAEARRARARGRPRAPGTSPATARASSGSASAGRPGSRRGSTRPRRCCAVGVVGRALRPRPDSARRTLSRRLDQRPDRRLRRRRAAASPPGAGRGRGSDGSRCSSVGDAILGQRVREKVRRHVGRIQALLAQHAAEERRHAGGIEAGRRHQADTDRGRPPARTRVEYLSCAAAPARDRAGTERRVHDREEEPEQRARS